MSWNYRVMRSTEPDGTHVFAIHEVYYDDAGRVNGWIADAAHPQGETFKELTHDLSNYQRAFSEHVLAIVGDELRDIGPMGTNDKKFVVLWKRSIPLGPVALSAPSTPASLDWKTAALLKDRTRAAIRDRRAAGEPTADLADDYGVPAEFVEAICAWQMGSTPASPPQDCAFLEARTCAQRWPSDQTAWCSQCLFLHLSNLSSRSPAVPGEP